RASAGSASREPPGFRVVRRPRGTSSSRQPFPDRRPNEAPMTRVTDPRPSLSEAALLMVLAAGTAVVTPLYSQQDLGRGEVTSAGPAEYHTRRNPDVPPPPRALAPLREHGPLRVPAGHSKLARPD